MKQFCKQHYFAASLLAAASLTLLGIFLWSVCVDGPVGLLSVFEFIPFFYLPCTIFFGYPIVLTLIELLLLFLGGNSTATQKPTRLFDLITLLMGTPFTLIYCSFIRNIEFRTDWETILYNTMSHTPIHTGFALTPTAFVLIGFIGYLILTYKPIEKLPPLIIVTSIAGMYLACGVEIMWCIQIMTRFDLWLLLLPLNVIVIAARTVGDKMREWKASAARIEQKHRLKPLYYVDLILSNANCWPIFAFLLMWPLLGVLICILALFGQRPNALIKAFTETSDWNLSQQISPQSLNYDGHYLCTVAAGGHQKLVKPLRKGVRHGHEIVVNRQLCVANAFEQILEEKTPGFHRLVRYIYDNYGFPIAKLIRTKCAADIVYLIMKPLEWCFLVVLYLTDPHPEDRIAVQYTGKNLREFQGVD